MTDTLLERIFKFVKQQEGTVTARFYSKQWHVMIIWDRGSVDADHEKLDKALTSAWLDVQKQVRS